MRIDSSGNVSIVNSLSVSTNNATGGGIILADDGDIVDLNTGYCAMRFSQGVQIYSGNKSGSPVVTLGSNGSVTVSGGRVLGLTDFSTGSASGTSIDYSTIPTWVKRITLVMGGVSTNNTSSIIIRLGDAGGVETTGYTSYCVRTSTTGISGGTDLTGFSLRTDNAAANLNGRFNISRVSGNTWAADWALGSQAGGDGHFGGGGKTLDTDLTTVRVTTIIGTQAFDAGTITVIIE
jgi:hypothetical protein